MSILWIAFILVSFLLGLSVSFLLDYPFDRLERALCSFVIGHALSIWVAFLLSVLMKSLSASSILLCIGLCAFVAVVLLAWTNRSGKWNVTDLKRRLNALWYEDLTTPVFLIGILLYVLFMNLYGVFRPDDAGSLYAFHTVWADYPWHTSLITSFSYHDSFTFPIDNPQFLGVKTHYSFIMDFYSAVLMQAGLTLRSAILIPNVLFQLSLFGLLYCLACRLTGLKWVGISATVIFILAGFPAGLQSLGIHFLNPMYAVIMPQRTALIGMAISFVVYLLLFHALCADEPEGTSSLREKHKELIVAGALIGLLPYIHAHSFMATGFVTFCLAAYYFLKDRDWRILISLFLPLLILSLPQVLLIRTGVSEGFFVFFPGWADTNSDMIMGFDWSSVAAAFSSVMKTTILVETFWALNAGALLVLLSLGFAKAKRETRIFYLPFLLLFLLANLVKFQPWYFDNYKLFLHWLALTAVMAPLALCWLPDTAKRGKSIVTIALAALLIGSTVFGVATHANMIQNTYVVWSGEEIAMAEWVRDSTPPDAVFLTGTAHNHPIPSLTGRPRVMGYEGWLWSHGIPWTDIDTRKRDMKAMYQGDFTVMQDYGVDYVCIGPYERTFALDNGFTINEEAFEDAARVELTYNTVIAGESWAIYTVKTPSSPA
ncbi:MAG TPA: hypothetical protein VMW67_06450 [Desulfobacteria bacterium]|nr:hypothetical protein [Desulfobacteria bacterium]